MSISQYKHSIGKATTDIQTQGKFLFYKRASSGISDTDVGVTVGGHYLGLISPTEHIKLNTGFQNLILTPNDPNNEALFVVADADEDFGTAQVAGAVTITGGTVAVSNFPATDDLLFGKTAASKAFISTVTDTTGTAATVDTVYFINPTDSGASAYLNKFTLFIQDQTSKADIAFTGTLTAYQHTQTTSSNYTYARKYNIAGGTVSGIGLGFISPAGLNGAVALMNLGTKKDLYFESPIKVDPGQAVALSLLFTAGGSSGRLVWVNSEYVK